MTDEPTMTRNGEASRYELRLGDDVIGLIDYRLDGGVIDLHHTEVNPEYGGRGYAGRLVAYALADARESGLRVVPSCPYVHQYMDRHPELDSLRV